ncbi:MaoC family dehydratase N-terminal domain-containing protein [Aneurinibacillus thermoaerophilus]|uniref:MaoC family dehydratase N-terminal domain-containing protein n=1 Tax=Aneurinibacillus thermoaerophilus TaxID=143495 RepID=UPI001FE36D9F|nr:MaoC family dehydratase N-terminal domain-containing protein [Aneurinibacillus thermoaerophilus]MED0674318.1 MaoC family dehydratase N-terminal domain-containing protein [Aneurinibacillus thermoaerophilus]MED0756984.1 MaoC family dehydratase N-terminal domain-containing protein [Aneurinibacillus thermoaerophilus]MED0761711.1 MaoC family dehydratase N-terminal domain-containing protein [Aneurinibacillus thermoaerophilus]
MANPEDKKGYTFAPYSGRVEAGKIRELALALGDDNPIYTDEAKAKEEGLDAIPIQPTFMEVIDMWYGSSFEDLMEQLDIDMKKLLHGEQEYEYFAPVYAGDMIYAETKVTDVKTKRNGMAFYTLETIYRNQNNEKVMAARMMLVKMP